MSSGIGRRLAAGVAVTAAITGGALIGAGTASAASEPNTPVIFGSADSASQGGVGLGGSVDNILFQFGVCAPIALPYMITSSDLPDFWMESCASYSEGAPVG